MKGMTFVVMAALSAPALAAPVVDATLPEFADPSAIASAGYVAPIAFGDVYDANGNQVFTPCHQCTYANGLAPVTADGIGTKPRSSVPPSTK